MLFRRILLFAFVALAAVADGRAGQAQSLTAARSASGIRPDDTGRVDYLTAPYVQKAGVYARQFHDLPRPLLMVHADSSVDSGAHLSRALHVVYGLLVGAATGWGTGIVLDSFLNRNSSRSCNGCDHVYVKMEVLTVPASAIIGGIVGALVPTR